MKKIIDFFASKKLAIILIIILVLLLTVSVIIPQIHISIVKRADPDSSSDLPVTLLSFNRRVIFPLIIAAFMLFFLNLLVCSTIRFTKQIKKKSLLRFGPDIIHLGLMLLIVGGILSFAGRRTELRFMMEGDISTVSGNYLLEVKEIINDKSEIIKTEDWTTLVDVYKNGQIIEADYAIKINKPLKIGGYKLYLNSYYVDGHLILADEDNLLYTLNAGQAVPYDNGYYLFKFISDDFCEDSEYCAAVEQWENDELIEYIVMKEGDMIGGYRIDGIAANKKAGIKAVRDPGYPPVLIAMVIVLAGFFVTYFQKIRGRKS